MGSILRKSCVVFRFSMGPIATRSFHDRRQLFVMFLSILSQMMASFNANPKDFQKNLKRRASWKYLPASGKTYTLRECKNFASPCFTHIIGHDLGSHDPGSNDLGSMMRPHWLHSLRWRMFPKRNWRTSSEADPPDLTVHSSHQRERVNSSRYKVDDPAPIPSIWKLATSAPRAHPSVKSELTVLLIADSTPSNQTEW